VSGSFNQKPKASHKDAGEIRRRRLCVGEISFSPFLIGLRAGAASEYRALTGEQERVYNLAAFNAVFLIPTTAQTRAEATKKPFSCAEAARR
jgi:hypothetical protein